MIATRLEYRTWCCGQSVIRTNRVVATTPRLCLLHCIYQWAMGNKEDSSMAIRRNQTQKAGNSKSMPATAATGMSPALAERVRFQAYLLFEERQHAGVPGDAVSDWLRAERELSAAPRQPQWTQPT
jgi:hypothetical protein